MTENCFCANGHESSLRSTFSRVKWRFDPRRKELPAKLKAAVKEWSHAAGLGCNGQTPKGGNFFNPSGGWHPNRAKNFDPTGFVLPPTNGK